jgi:hypothetical protein
MFLRGRRVGLWATLLLAGLLFLVGTAAAQGSSTYYRIDESYIGPGGNLESNSDQYGLEPGQSSLNGTAGGEGSSTDYRIQSGTPTTSDPRLSCVVNTASTSFGALSTSVTSTGTATFSVLNYTSYGYNVSILGTPPSNGSHSLTPMASTAAALAGSEQFGINLVANTSPTTIGAAPVQVPDNTFAFGAAAANYNTANNYRYNSGETIASAPKSSGQTNFTISYVVNVSTTTPGGKYSGQQEIVCTGTY